MKHIIFKGQSKNEDVKLSSENEWPTTAHFIVNKIPKEKINYYDFNVNLDGHM